MIVCKCSSDTFRRGMSGGRRLKTMFTLGAVLAMCGAVCGMRGVARVRHVMFVNHTCLYPQDG